MTQCLRWVTDAYNEFLVSGMLSEERVNRLQMVYDKLRTSESMSHANDIQTMSNLSSMMVSSVPAGMQIPSLASAIPSATPGERNTATDDERHRSRSRSVEKPAVVASSDVTAGRRGAQNKPTIQSPGSRASSGLANTVTMEFGSERGADGAYSPFDSPFNFSDANLQRDPCPAEFGLGNINMQGSFMHNMASNNVPPTTSPPNATADDRGRVKPAAPLLQKPPVMTPQDILAARIADEIALIEVLVRIQYELSSIGDLSAEDAAASGISVVGGPSTPPEVTAALQSPPSAASADPNSLVGDTSDLPALPSPRTLQEMIAQSSSVTSTTQQSQDTTAPVSQPTVALSHGGKAIPSTAVVRGKMPSTPPIPTPTSTPTVTTSAGVPTQPVTGACRTSASTVTKSQASSSSSQPAESSKMTDTSKPSSTTAKPDSAKNPASKDGDEKVFIELLLYYTASSCSYDDGIYNNGIYNNGVI